MMTKIIKKIMLLTCFMPLISIAQKQSGYEIRSRLTGLAEGGKVIMQLAYSQNDLANKDSCYVRDGQFDISGIVPEGPRYYILEIPCLDKELRYIRLFIDNKQDIIISGGNVNIEHSYIDRFLQINGSPSNTAYTLFVNSIFPLFQNYLFIDKRIKAIGDSIGFDPSLLKELKNTKENTIKIIRAMSLGSQYGAPDEYLAFPFVLQDVVFEKFDHPGLIPEAYNEMDSSQRNTFYGKWLKKLLPLCVGQLFYPFSLPDQNGQIVSLKDIVPKNKVTIVHFWGRESVDREKYQQQLLALYSKYHSRGLGVVGISADTSADDFVFTIHQKKYPWVNVSDLKGWGKGSIINDVYGEGGHRVPNTTNVLLDSAGKIIAWDPQGVELQWYLWKYLGD